MRTLLLVDDDKDILCGLEQTVNWQQCGIERVYTASNGLQALELLQKVLVDVVMTDIKMPGMDGLSLAKQMRACGYEAELIILSGFGEFEYAQQAMQYGAVGYALKPINIDECMQLVSKALEKRAMRQTHRELQQAVQSADTALWEHTLRDLTLGRTSMETAKKTVTKMGYARRQYDVAVIAVLGLDKSDLDILTAKAFVAKCCPQTPVIITAERLLTVYFQKKMTVKELRFLFEETFVEMELNYGVAIKVGMGRGLYELAALPEAYRDARNALQDVYFDPDTRYFETRIPQSSKGNTELQSITKLISGRNSLICHQKLDAAFDRLANCCNRNHVDAVKSVIHTMLANLEQYCMDELLHSSMTEEFAAAKQAVHSSWTLAQDRAALKTLVCAIQCKETEDPTTGKDALAGKLKKYIRANFEKDIDLYTAAEALMKNPNYLSHVFSDSCGVTFSEYLNHTRIEQAKMRLSQSDDTVYAIAMQVGYNSERYFMTIFKKLTGLTPTQFRNRT